MVFHGCACQLLRSHGVVWMCRLQLCASKQTLLNHDPFTHIYTHVSTHTNTHMQVAHIMMPLLKFWFHEEVRRAAHQTLPELIRSATICVEKGRPGVDKAYIKGVSAARTRLCVCARAWRRGDQCVCECVCMV